MTQVLAFPSASRDTPLNDEQLATHRNWAAWATGQGHPDIPLTYRPVNRPFDIDHPPFAIGDRAYLTIDSFFVDRHATREGQIGTVEDICPKYSILKIVFWYHTVDRWRPEYRLAYIDEVLNIQHIPTGDAQDLITQISALRNNLLDHTSDPPPGISVEPLVQSAFRQQPWPPLLLAHDRAIRTSYQVLTAQMTAYNNGIYEAIRAINLSAQHRFPTHLQQPHVREFLLLLLQLTQNSIPARHPTRIHSICHDFAFLLEHVILPTQATAACVELLLLYASVLTIGPDATVTALSDDHPHTTRPPPTLADFFHAQGGTLRNPNVQPYDFTHVTSNDTPPHPLPSSLQYQHAIDNLRSLLPVTTSAVPNPTDTVVHSLPDSTHSDLATARSDLAATRAELTAVKELLSAERKSSLTATADLQAATLELNQAHIDSRDLQSQLDIAHQDVHKLRAECNTLRSQLASTQKQLDNSSAMVAGMSTAFTTVQSDMALPRLLIEGLPSPLHAYLQSTPVLTFVRSICTAFEAGDPHWQVLPTAFPAPTLAEVIIAFQTRPTTLPESTIPAVPQGTDSPSAHLPDQFPPQSNPTSLQPGESDDHTDSDILQDDISESHTVPIDPNATTSQSYSTTEDTLLSAWEVFYRLLWPANSKDLQCPRNFGHIYFDATHPPQSLPKHHHVLIMGLECIRYAMLKIVKQTSHVYYISSTDLLDTTLTAYRTFLNHKKNNLHNPTRVAFMFSRLSPALLGFLSPSVLNRLARPYNTDLTTVPRLPPTVLPTFLQSLQEARTASIPLPDFCKPIFILFPSSGNIPLHSTPSPPTIPPNSVPDLTAPVPRKRKEPPSDSTNPETPTGEEGE